MLECRIGLHLLNAEYETDSDLEDPSEAAYCYLIPVEEEIKLSITEFIYLDFDEDGTMDSKERTAAMCIFDYLRGPGRTTGIPRKLKVMPQ